MQEFETEDFITIDLRGLLLEERKCVRDYLMHEKKLGSFTQDSDDEVMPIFLNLSNEFLARMKSEDPTNFKVSSYCFIVAFLMELHSRKEPTRISKPPRLHEGSNWSIYF